MTFTGNRLQIGNVKLYAAGRAASPAGRPGPRAEDSGGQAALLTSASTFGRNAGYRLRNAFFPFPVEYARPDQEREFGFPRSIIGRNHEPRPRSSFSTGLGLTLAIAPVKRRKGEICAAAPEKPRAGSCQRPARPCSRMQSAVGARDTASAPLLA